MDKIEDKKEQEIEKEIIEKKRKKRMMEWADEWEPKSCFFDENRTDVCPHLEERAKRERICEELAKILLVRLWYKK